MIRLPATVSELRGLRAARWIRESTAGQFDRYGPDAQRELHARAIARLGLLDTSIEYSAAQSGRTVYSGAAMRRMLEDAAGGAFDVLVVAYVARWQRNLLRTLQLLEDELHPAGVAVYFCDEELLSSCERHWDTLVDEAKAAESWLRKHRRRVKEGLAAKLATKRDPGGRPPFGFRRDPATKLVEPDPLQMPTVRRAFDLSAAGATDREVAASLGLPLFTVRGMLTSPLYVGRLRDGGPANWPPIVELDVWNRVAALRLERNRRSPGRPEVRRTYLLPMLECDACGRRLVGDNGRYRHLDACDAFLAAVDQPARPVRGQHRRIPGQSYAQDVYEDVVPFVLERLRLGAGDIAAAIAEYSAVADPGPDRLELARIAQERDRALDRFLRDRDTPALEAAMARCDEDERRARETPQPAARLTAAEIRGYLEDLPRWWAAVEDKDRKALAEQLFERVRALGARRVVIDPTPAAIARGISAAFGPDDVEMVGARGLRTTISVSSPPDAPPAIRVA